MSKTFKHRFVVVTETAHVVGKPTYRYRSFPRKWFAEDRADAARKRIGTSHFERVYVVDTFAQPEVILP